MKRDEKLLRLVKDASRSIDGLEWTERNQSHLTKVLSQREEETVENLHELIAYIRKAYCLKGETLNDD
jgi:hypothetical protein